VLERHIRSPQVHVPSLIKTDFQTAKYGRRKERTIYIGRLSGGVHLGGRRAAPFDAVEHIERRSKRSRPEAMPPDEYRSEGTPSLSEGPDARGETFASFGAFAKGSRRKGIYTPDQIPPANPCPNATAV
jgi:hypothetical protein